MYEVIYGVVSTESATSSPNRAQLTRRCRQRFNLGRLVGRCIVVSADTYVNTVNCVSLLFVTVISVSQMKKSTAIAAVFPVFSCRRGFAPNVFASCNKRTAMANCPPLIFIPSRPGNDDNVECGRSADETMRQKLLAFCVHNYLHRIVSYW